MAASRLIHSPSFVLLECLPPCCAIGLVYCGIQYSYKTPPVVRISPPADPTGVQAEARVILDKRNGFITDIEVINPGSGYSSALAPVTVEVSVCVGAV